MSLVHDVFGDPSVSTSPGSSIALGAPPISLKATFLAADGSVDTTGAVTWADADTTIVSIVPEAADSVQVTAVAIGTTSITATIVDPDGNTVTTPPYPLTVTKPVVPSTDAVSGTIAPA